MQRDSWRILVSRGIGIVDLLGAGAAGLGTLAAVVVARFDPDDPLNGLAIYGSLVTAVTYGIAGVLLVMPAGRARAGLLVGSAGVGIILVLIHGMRLAGTSWLELVPYWLGAAAVLCLHAVPLGLWWRALALGARPEDAGVAP